MRSDPENYELVAPGSLQAALALLANEPGAWLPIAGGTDLMVRFGAGMLPERNFVSIWNLPELRKIEESADEIAIGAGSTYTDLREHSGVARHFPLLVRAASWTGGIANQNRGTLGGNIANASPAADCPPVLLVYDAELTLASIRGERRIAYRNFHLGYKKTAMAADELIRAIHLKKQFSSYMAYARKVGARQSQAIAKINIAAVGRLASGLVEDVRIALGSVAPVPLRLDKMERLLIGKKTDAFSESDLRRMVADEIAPIADIRSTAQYRSAVASNLVLEFLDRLRNGEGDAKVDGEEARERSGETEVLKQWNLSSYDEAWQNILPCCGSRTWARAMADQRPLENVDRLFEAASEIWRNLASNDRMEAFHSHPRIGESRPQTATTVQSQHWSSQEQQQVAESNKEVRLALAEANRRYEERFNRIFIVCASGKSPDEILQILERRLRNDEAAELRESAQEQEQIMMLRLRKWLKE